jgi:hypothetical protein
MKEQIFIKIKFKIVFYYNDLMIKFIEKAVEKRLIINSPYKPFFVYSSDDYGKIKNNS